MAVAGSQATRLQRYALAALRARYSGFALEEPGMAWLGQDVSSGFALGQYLRQRQAGSATLLALCARGAWRGGGGSTQQSNGWGVREVGVANELKNEDWLRAERRKKWLLVDGMKYGCWQRMHNNKESCYLKRKVHPGG